jgi:adenylate kinase family enzyme
MNQLPQIIILYGPVACGKGTQSQILKEKLPNYTHLETGGSLREFVALHIGKYNESRDNINPTSSSQDVAIAKSIKQNLACMDPVPAINLRYVLEKKINLLLESGANLIVDGVGRTKEESEWFAGLLASKKVSLAIFHLHLSELNTINRSTHRFYSPSNKNPFPSYDAAKANCKEGEKPYQRVEDQDIEGISKRYNLMYGGNWAKMLAIYQKALRCSLLTVDANQSIEAVTNDILFYIDLYYGVKVTNLNL